MLILVLVLDLILVSQVIVLVLVLVGLVLVLVLASLVLVLNLVLVSQVLVLNLVLACPVLVLVLVGLVLVLVLVLACPVLVNITASKTFKTPVRSSPPVGKCEGEYMYRCGYAASTLMTRCSILAAYLSLSMRPGVQPKCLRAVSWYELAWRLLFTYVTR